MKWPEAQPILFWKRLACIAKGNKLVRVFTDGQGTYRTEIVPPVPQRVRLQEILDLFKGVIARN